MKVGLIDVDGHNFPNLALMRISAYNKSKGDDVEWWWALGKYDVVYMSKVFSDAYTADIPEPLNADYVIKGGTGYCITLGEDGKEHFDQSKNISLCAEAEAMFPDYSIYPQFDFAISMTSRGCPRQCKFCHVAAKEGCQAICVASVGDFWNGQKEIRVLDPNITACKDKRELFRDYRNTGAVIDFTQGLDIRLLDDDDIDDINHMRLRFLHFAWDNPNENLAPKFERFSQKFRRKSNIGTVYVLTNFNSTMEQNLERIYKLREMRFDPFVMVYDKPNAPKEILQLQRWCNSKWVFNSCERFEDYQKADEPLEGQMRIKEET